MHCNVISYQSITDPPRGFFMHSAHSGLQELNSCPKSEPRILSPDVRAHTLLPRPAVLLPLAFSFIFFLKLNIPLRNS